jgi:hypothetical protein
MAASSVATYHHNKTPEGSWTSICLCCFRTVAACPSQFMLDQQESTHTCDPVDFFTME